MSRGVRSKVDVAIVIGSIVVSRCVRDVVSTVVDCVVVVCCGVRYGVKMISVLHSIRMSRCMRDRVHMLRLCDSAERNRNKYQTNF